MTDYGDDFIRVIGALALDIFMNRSNELSCELPIATDRSHLQAETPDYRIEGDAIYFASIETRNRMVADYMFMEKRVVLANDDAEWLVVAHDLWRKEIGKSDSAAGRLLALVHEMGDIFTIAANVIENKTASTFDVLHSIESALPYLAELPPNGVLKLTAAQHEGTKNDLAGGMFFHKLEEKLVGLPDTCREIHVLLKNTVSETTSNIYPILLIALAKSHPIEALELSLEDVESSNMLLKNPALWTLGRLLAMSLVTDDAQSTVAAILIDKMSSTVEEVRRTAIRAAANTAHITNTFDDCLTKLGEVGDQYALSVIADAIYMSTSEFRKKEGFGDWLKLLCNLSPVSSGILHQFDYVLSQLIADESQQQLAIFCLTEWCRINAVDTPRDKSIAALFNTTVHELANRPHLLSQVITDWFLDDNIKLAAAGAGLLSHLWVSNFRNPAFSTPRLDTLTQNDLLFLARRMLGFVFSEEHLLSLTMSLLKTNDAKQRTFGIVYALLVDEIGQDYPSSSVNVLESTKASTEETELVGLYTRAIESINHRIDTLNALSRLAELRPPPSIQRGFAKARDKQMRESMEEAQKGSIMRQLCTEIPLKAGIGSFSFRDGVYGEPTYMQSISHSVSVPMREAQDSVGYDISHLLFRIAKREEA